MNQNQLVIKGTILGLTYEQWVKDMSMFVSTSLMVIENWASVTFNFAQEFRLEHSEHARKRLGETRQALIALSNDIHTLANCYQLFQQSARDGEINNRLRALNYASHAETYFSNIRSIYDHLATFPRIILADKHLKSRAACPDSMNDLIKFCNREPLPTDVYPEEVINVIKLMASNLENIRVIRNAIQHNGKEPVISFEADGRPTIKIPAKIGNFTSPNMLPDILDLKDKPYPLFDYLREMTLRLLDDMECLGDVLLEPFADQLEESRKLMLFGLTGYCMEDFLRFLFPGGEKEHVARYKVLLNKVMDQSITAQD
ncbi:MAG: hypothetical protein ACXVJD_03110 [Mucilaginibacter sp.]